MEIRELIQGLETDSVRLDGPVEITGISYDSRSVEPGHLFVAIRGTREDGEDHIRQALERGAACVMCRRPVAGVPCITVPDGRRALADVSARWFGYPAGRLQVVGVTGTNGKTTSAYMLRYLLERMGRSTGLIGTVENVVGGRVLPARRTTPESRDLQELLSQMAEAGCTHAVMEVSSHALALERVRGIPYAAALFTNLTRDHLDFHGTMEAYGAAKARLFHQCAAAALNADDPAWRQMAAGSDCPRLLYGLGEDAGLRAENVRLSRRGVAFQAVAAGERLDVSVPVPGRFTVYNALGVLAVCRLLGLPAAACAAALGQFPGVPGRMETVPTPGRDYTVLIDYAHTPDALENVLRAARGFAEGRVIALFGCGGDRDRTKRPQMGAIAQRLAHWTVVTSDNPRTEDPAAIIREITAGMTGENPYTVIEDRAEAIAWALSRAKRGDVVLLCGKGHETYQEIGGVRRPMDEREIVAQAIR